MSDQRRNSQLDSLSGAANGARTSASTFTVIAHSTAYQSLGTSWSAGLFNSKSLSLSVLDAAASLLRRNTADPRLKGSSPADPRNRFSPPSVFHLDASFDAPIGRNAISASSWHLGRHLFIQHNYRSYPPLALDHVVCPSSGPALPDKGRPGQPTAVAPYRIGTRLQHRSRQSPFAGKLDAAL